MLIQDIIPIKKNVRQDLPARKSRRVNKKTWNKLVSVLLIALLLFFNLSEIEAEKAGVVLANSASVVADSEVIGTQHKAKAQAEEVGQETFKGMDKTAIEQQILNEMRPAKTEMTDNKKWKLTGIHFSSLLKEKASDSEPWSYIENDKKLSFAHREIGWNNGEIIKTGTNDSVGEIEELSINYSNTLGEGINTKIIQDNYKWQKIIEIESLEALGEIPEEVEYLEISFDISGDFDFPEGKIIKPISFGKNSFIQQVKAWDSSPENPDVEVISGTFGEIKNDVLIKRIPIALLKSAIYPIYTDATITYGAENVFNPANTDDISVAALDSTHFVVAYRDIDNANHGTAIIGVISGTTISSYGAESIFNPGGIIDCSVAALDSTHFVVVFSDGLSSLAGTARVGVVSGTTISSYGAKSKYNNLFASYNSVAALDSTHFVVSFKDTTAGGHGIAVVGVVSGTTISSYGAKNTYNAAITSYISVSTLDSTHFVVAYKDEGNSNHGTAIVGEVSGTTISSYGAENVFNSAITSYISVSTLDSTHFVVAYKDEGNSNHGTAIVGEVSGTTISSYGAENVFNSAITSYTSVSTLDSTHFVAAYNDVGNSNYGTAIVGEVSGTTISSYGAENVFNSAITSYISVSTLDSTHFVVAYKDEGNSNHGTAIVGTTEIPIPTVTTQAASSVEATIATGNGNITDIGGENCTTRGFCYMTGTTGDPTTADSVAFDAGSFTTGTYTKEIIGLTPGTNYRVRAYAINSAGTGYGTTVQILTKPAAPTSVSATDGVHTDKTVITWTKSTGATGYKVYEGTNLLDTLGDVATYDDTAATAPTITSGSTVAGDGTNAAHIAIDLSGTSANNGSSRTYKVVALNATGDSADSDTDTGYRGVGSLTYQWQRSAGDSDLTYSNITGAIASAYNDTAAPIYTINAPTSVTVDATSASVLQITYSGASITDGEGRYYQCVLNADGASQQTSSSNRGYRDDTIADSNGYEIFSDTESGGSYSTSEGLDTASTFDDTGLSSNTRKYYKVKTKSTDNVWSDLSSSYAGKYTLANIPTTLSLTTDSSTQITALWSDNSNPANTEYYIENSTAGTNSGWTTSTSWISPDLSCGTNYSFKVKSRNGENVDSNYTSSVSIETGGCASGMPSSAYNSPSPPEPTPENPENNFSLTINNGSEYTNDQIVTLKLISGPDTVRMAISNTSDFKYASQIDYQEEIIWDLCEKNGDNPACVPDSEFQISGSQFTVYAKFYTQYGVASETISVSINYISDLNENNLIIGPDGIKVYTINKNNYKRHIFNPTVFEMYLHLKWENIKKVSQTILDSFKTSDLYRTTGKNQVYFLEEIDEIKGKAIKHHLDVTPEDFSQKGYDWNEVFIANKKEDGYYEEGEEIQ